MGSPITVTKRVERVLPCCLFSVTCLARLLRYTREYIYGAGAPSLDLLAVSRLDNLTAADLLAHLAHFLALGIGPPNERKISHIIVPKAECKPWLPSKDAP
ncbi:uncharacterized protein BDZ83DRAFT_642621 [Colletotrichum acutatum]|uniref:Uncharacterized protein n=1 Tax=Glomerella acutata TaxID=27357 RepID=A0AAD8UA98_GLOAC|nr:uncharacterized protein BDZ83DRAFT_642621 [Colletotrichum acutatum]KAK1707761.1 hypothetical protein BDZ83DRAFT_642621 [Colletotrichum acutatum]